MRTSTTTPSANPAATTGWRGWQATTETRACDFAISFGWRPIGPSLPSNGQRMSCSEPDVARNSPPAVQPKLMAKSQARVSVVACHPRQPVVAAGFADGVVVLVRIDDGALILVKGEGTSPVSALGWAASGQMLAFGTEAGEAGALSF